MFKHAAMLLANEITHIVSTKGYKPNSTFFQGR